MPTVPDTDRRLLVLEGDADEDWDEEDLDEDDAEDAEAAGDGTVMALHAFLENQTKAQLIDLLAELAQRYPDVRGALEARRNLAAGTVDHLVHDVRKLIATTSSEPAWRDEWSGEGSTPDYTEVRDRLELLLSQGYADEVIDLGEYLLEAGKQQIEESHDEGETAGEIAVCMEPVFRALAQSSLSPAE